MNRIVGEVGQYATPGPRGQPVKRYGLQREQNEDSLYTQVMDDGHPASGVFIVSDGMGGYHAGEVASQLAVETIRRQNLLMLFATPATRRRSELDTPPLAQALQEWQA